jgi:hypothetical protein
MEFAGCRGLVEQLAFGSQRAGNGIVPGGIAEFRRLHPGIAAKIDTDGAIPPDVRLSFWTEIDAWPGGSVTKLANKACLLRQFLGPVAALDPSEHLGTAQSRGALESGLSRQKPPRLPALLRTQVRHYLGGIERDPDRSSALATFKVKFAHLRLRSIRGGRKKVRIFGFRNPASPLDPINLGSLADTFTKLSIPAASAADYVILAYKPANDDLVHLPTCFDANMRNLDEFVPGGKTAGGMDEVISTPPRCANVTQAPRPIV